MNTFPFSLLTPDGTIVEGDVTQVEVRTYSGSLGVLARHEPMVAACPPGAIRIHQGGVWVHFRTGSAVLTTDGTSARILTSQAWFETPALREQ